MFYLKDKTSNSIRYLKNVQSYHVVRKYIGIWKIFQETTHAIYPESVPYSRHVVGNYLLDILFNITPPFIQRPLKRKPEKLCKIRNMKHPLITLYTWKVKGAGICFGLSLKRQLNKTPRFVVFWCVSSASRRPTPHSRPTVKQIEHLKQELSPHPPYSPDLDPSDFHQIWSPEDPLLGRNFRSVEEVNVAVCDWKHSSQNLLLSRNLCRGGKLEEVCRTWWGMHWRLM
jgi:hypothetical protein